MLRYVIIGCGAAGVAAAESLRRCDPHADLLPICEEADGYYSRPGLAYYLTGEIPETQLYPFSEKDYRRLNLRPLHARVVGIYPAEYRVELQNGKSIAYDRLLIATGASAVRADVPGQDFEGVVKLDTLDEARRILKFAHKARSAVIVGGGITALELVEGLRARGVKTHYFLRSDRYWSNVLDETESQIVEGRLKEEGVQIHYHTELAEILGKGGRVVGVRTKDGRQIPCGIAAIAIGVRPRKELAVAAGLKVDRGILVDEYLQTNHPHIYAAGDVAQVYDPFSGKSIVDSLWGPAVEQGHAAGLNMTGQKVTYLKTVAFNVTRLAGLTTTIIGTVGQGRDDDLVGIARGDSETWRQMPDAIASQNNFSVNRLRVLVGKQTMVGGIVMGDQTLSRAVHHLIAQKVDITPIREQLLQPDNTSLGDLIADFYTHWRSSAAA
jgi:NADPH-dependent 2,4-dienoyl-CoA reductase/sulfur reductase-like enzyme